MLDYPIDSGLILRKKISIKKNLLLKDNLLIKNIAILGGSTTAEIKNILELFLLDNGIRPNFYESDYNKYFEDAVFNNKLLGEFKPDIIYIHTTNKNISFYPRMYESPSEVDDNLQSELKKFATIWSSLEKYHCAIIQNNFELPMTRILGNLDCYDHRGSVNYINKLNAYFADQAKIRSNLYINDINYLAATVGLPNWHDNAMWYSYKYALSCEAIPHLAKSIAVIIGAISGKLKKCMVLDLDNTCWGGVIGDDGLNGIVIGKETALAEAYTDFQRYVKTLKERGIVLAVCSKNETRNAKEGFTHPDTVLVNDDFAAFEANWNHKPDNIAKISESLNLGLDSFVFIDDNPAEREMVSAKLAMISVPDIGSDIVNFINHIDKNYYFETVSLSGDDLIRNEYYQNNAARLEQEFSFKDYGEYLNSLEMTAEIKPFSLIYLNRITQLINKTNQFNLTNRRCTLVEVEAMVKDPGYITLYGRLEDKFGDNGLITVVVGKIKNDECHLELWLMSCRVFKRDMEYAMLDQVVKQCRAIGIKKIVGYYFKTEKNAMVSTLYKDFGFVNISSGDNTSVWEIDVAAYVYKNKHIKEVYD